MDSPWLACPPAGVRGHGLDQGPWDRVSCPDTRCQVCVPRQARPALPGLVLKLALRPPYMPIPGQCLEWEPCALWGPRRALPAGCVVLQEAEVGPPPWRAWTPGHLLPHGRAVTLHVLTMCGALLISEGHVSRATWSLYNDSLDVRTH